MVDDEPHLLELMEIFTVSSRGIAILTASNGAEALDRRSLLMSISSSST